MSKEKIVISGTDARFIALKECLKKEFEIISDIKECDILILPLPCNMESAEAEKLFGSLKPNALVLAGKVSDNINRTAKQYNINLKDYYTDEFEILNAIPSAEGAIEIAMQETDFTLSGSKTVVLGYGRIGKVLAKMLNGIGSDVTVSARRKESLATAKSLGLKTQSLYNLAPCIKDADIIFNTIPSLILNRENLLNVKKDALIIDLASKPGGVDFKCAENLGIKTIHALGLPAKTSPKTASGILANSIYSFIEERRTNGT